MHKISLLPIHDSVTLRPGAPILPALLAKNLRILMSCGGNGICSTCHVRVRQGMDELSPMEARERRTLSLVDGADASSRLACQTQVHGDGVVLELPPGMYIETVDDLIGLLGERAPENILHPIRGQILIPKGKIITRTLLEQSRSLDGEVRRMKGGLLGLDEPRPGTGAAAISGFAATGRGLAPKTSKGNEAPPVPSSLRNAMPAASVLVSVSRTTASSASARSPNGQGATRPEGRDGATVGGPGTVEPAADRGSLPGPGNAPEGWDDGIEVASATDTGMRRSNNQDSLAIVKAPGPDLWRSRGHIFLVADGMGGHAAGDVASKLASETIPEIYHQMSILPPAEALLKAYRKAGSLIHARASSDPECRGMGTTCSTLLLLPEGALIAHVGDSRVYRIRRGKIDQLSFDHSMAWEMIRVGLVPVESARGTIARNVITRSLGLDPNIEVDIEGPLPLQADDVFLLCSDGLSGHVDDPEMGLLASLFGPEDAARYLIALANLRGGRDNISVILARVAPANFPDSPRQLPAPRKALEPGEERIYRTASCAVTEELLGTLADQMKKSLEVAREQDWPLDWSSVAGHRRLSEQALSEGRFRDSARAIGEALVELGTSGRRRKDATRAS